jgi:hypothetical protein
MSPLNEGKVRGQLSSNRDRQHRHTILRAFALSDHDLLPVEVDVLDAKLQAVGQPQPRSVEQRDDEPLVAS